MRSAHHVGSVIAFMALTALAWGAGCGSNGNGAGGNGGDGGSSSSGSSGGQGSSSGIVFRDVNQCTVNGQCIMGCPDANKQTTITGTVYDPAGNNPLAGVAVYVPSSLPLSTLPKGAHCGDCSTLYTNAPLASGISGPDGVFHIVGAPSGQGVPIVVQAGKWRALYSATAMACVDNVIPPTTTKFRLPRNSSDTGGASLPDIAISTGGLDSLECMLTRIGIDPAEYTSGTGGTGHIHIFQGGGGGSNIPGPTMQGGSPASQTALWASAATLQPYDVVLLSCEGGETAGQNPTALEAYVKNGGRVFASHFHYSWFTASSSPFASYGLGQFQAGTQDTLNINAVINTGFPQGQLLHDWLALPQVGALTNDQLPIQQSRQNVLQYNDPPVKSWIQAAPGVSSPAMAGLTQYFSFDIRSGEIVCGRVVYSDLHVGAASADYGDSLRKTMTTQGGITPSGCNSSAKLSPQEAVLEYMLFDLSSCLTPPNMPKPKPGIAM